MYTNHYANHDIEVALAIGQFCDDDVIWQCTCPRKTKYTYKKADFFLSHFTSMVSPKFDFMRKKHET